MCLKMKSNLLTKDLLGSMEQNREERIFLLGYNISLSLKVSVLVVEIGIGSPTLMLSLKDGLCGKGRTGWEIG